MYDDFTCEARVRFRGKDLALNKIVARVELDDMAPARGPVDPFNYNFVQQAAERRQRFIDMISAEFAHALTEALYADPRKV